MLFLLRAGRMNVRVGVACFLLTACLAGVDAQQELEFAGSLELPPVVRFADLPRRMYLEPELRLPDEIPVLDETLLSFFQRLVTTAPDDEILIDAVQSLERVVREELANISEVAPALQKQLNSSQNHLVKQACAATLAAVGQVEFAADVAKLCVPQYEALCVRIEPDFVSWGGAALQPTWMDRVQQPDRFSNVLVRLACEGLTQLKAPAAVDPAERLLKSRQPYAMRHAAARAIGALEPELAANTAVDFSTGNVTDRLLACALLEHSKSDSALTLLEKFCDDSANIVASRAWETLLVQEPDRLLKRLDRGVGHQDSNVRRAVTHLVRRFPTIECCDAANLLTADVHIGVRNAARQALRMLATDQPQRRTQILQNAGATVSAADSTWQQVEQALILLGELRHREWQTQCVRWLDHDRPEVSVTAAWLLHLMPESSVAEEVSQLTVRRYAMNPPPEAVHVQLIFLFQQAGLLQTKSLQPLCEQQFAKSAGDPETRAAGLWALGKINQGQPQKSLSDRLVERIFDDDVFEPEYFIVRRMSVQALTWMNDRSKVSDLQRARPMYGINTMLGETIRWALPKLGAEQPAPLEPSVAPVGGFPISPL